MKNLQRLFKKASIETEVFLEIPFYLKPYRGQGLKHKHAKTTTHFMTAVFI